MPLVPKTTEGSLEAFWQQTSPNKNEIDDQVQVLTLDETPIPKELLVTIFSFLEAEDLVNCSLVCKIWKRLASNPILWFEFAKSVRFFDLPQGAAYFRVVNAKELLLPR